MFQPMSSFFLCSAGVGMQDVSFHMTEGWHRSTLLYVMLITTLNHIYPSPLRVAPIERIGGILRDRPV